MNLDPKMFVPPPLRTEDQVICTWNNQGEPLASIYCPTFNHVSFIEDALKGLLGQVTNFPFEIVVGDDSSIDGTSDVVRDFSMRYPKIIRHFRAERNEYTRGMQPFVNFYPHLRGRYIAWCDGDDYWVDPKKLQKQVDFLETNFDYAITYADSVRIDQHQVVTPNFGAVVTDLSQDQLQKGQALFTMTACFRREFPEMPAELHLAKVNDVFMWSIHAHFGKGKFLDTVVPSVYRVHSGGIFSLQANETRQRMMLQTDAALFSYYARVGNGEMRDYFEEKMRRKSLEKTSTGRLLKELRKRFGRKFGANWNISR